MAIQLTMQKLMYMKLCHNSSPKYVFSLDEYDMSKDGIIHFNMEEWLLNKIDVILS